MKILLLCVCLFALMTSRVGAQAMWYSAEERVQGASLIAIVDIEKVHEASPQKGIAIQSARAKVEKVFYLINSTPESELPTEIQIYCIVLTPHGDCSDRGSLFEGRAFVLLRRDDRFFTFYSGLELQPYADGKKLFWPNPNQTMTNDEVPLEIILADIEKYRPKNPSQ